MDNDPANRPNLQLSRRSLVAAGALLGALGPFTARKALADPPTQQETIWQLCTNGQLSNDPDNGHPGCLCFLSGTRLLTPAAEVAIENLRVGDLINGETIAAVDVAGDQLVYYHIELETHEVLVADGVPCESLLTTAEKLAVFDNVDEYYALHGAPADMAPCAPLAIFNGGRSELKSRLRSAVAVVVDRRQPRDIVRDRLEARALALSKAA
jgi:hypothetical protein